MKIINGVPQLEQGMLVEYRDGSLGIIIMTNFNDISTMCIVEESGMWISFENYNDDLTHIVLGDLDIVKVYSLTEFPNQALTPSIAGRKLLWERVELPKENPLYTNPVTEKQYGYIVDICKQAGFDHHNIPSHIAPKANARDFTEADGIIVISTLKKILDLY